MHEHQMENDIKFEIRGPDARQNTFSGESRSLPILVLPRLFVYAFKRLKS